MSLLPICEKIFQRIIFNSLYKYVEENRLLSVHQSGFCSNDSCVNRLLSIVCNLDKTLVAYPTLETCGLFLDMSKVFDKVWHRRQIFLNCNLAVPQPTWGHPWGDSLTNLLLITVFSTIWTQWSPGASWKGWVPKLG